MQPPCRHGLGLGIDLPPRLEDAPIEIGLRPAKIAVGRLAVQAQQVANSPGAVLVLARVDLWQAGQDSKGWY